MESMLKPLPLPLSDLPTILTISEIILPSSPEYASECLTWSSSKNLQPKVIARPNTVQSLSKLLAFISINGKDIDLSIRAAGVGSSSAKDLVISMSAFNHFKFHAAKQGKYDFPTITIGVGQEWGSVDAALATAAPGYACLSARCPFVGVGGSLTTGGLSWLSCEYGLASDPGNLLDATFVLADGRIVNSAAEEEPDLLWTIRGGGGSFGIVVSVTLRAFPDYSPKGIFTGRILYPHSSLDKVISAVADFSKRTSDPKMACHLFGLMMEPQLMKTALSIDTAEANRGVAIQMYDANGEEHGRSEEGFKWAMDIEGAVVMAEILDHRGVNLLEKSMKDEKGVNISYLSGITVPKVDEELMHNAWKWVDNLHEKEPVLAEIPFGTLVLVEILQKPALQSLKSPSDAGWPHTETGQHIIQLGVAAPKNRPDLDAFIFQALADAPGFICGNLHTPADFFPNFLHSFNDPKMMYGQNYGKLVELKKRFDPQGLLKGPFC